MGCNESKHSVATDNTAISHRKKPNKRSHKNVVSPVESIPESAVATNATTEKEPSPPTKQPESEKPNKLTIESSNNNINEVVPKATEYTEAASDVKDISVNLPIVNNEEEEKKEETTQKEDVTTKERNIEEENVNKVVSQDQLSDREDYLSSRKERGSIDSIVSDHDGYYSPHHELPTPREGRDDDQASDEHEVKVDTQLDEVEGLEEKGEELAQEHQNEKETSEVVVEALAEKEAKDVTKEAKDVTKITEKQSTINATEAPPSGLQQEAQTAT
ncbi:hypothetical protein Sjap_006759 [Stephania japonica]|uniref:Uncharacterized protein n=1 Tax=Stephania japonica TaxID=461633 RepID=A0AAP0K6K0_9MAGN